MNKLVYLFELDSVRNTPQEIERGQQALYEEIVLNGNRVVLTFNQLVDSWAFLCMLRDAELAEYVSELFEIGVLKISCFRRGFTASQHEKYVRTASQYVQESLRTCLANNENTFLFSALPLKSDNKGFLKLILQALKYGDIECLEMLKGDYETWESRALSIIAMQEEENHLAEKAVDGEDETAKKKRMERQNEKLELELEKVRQKVLQTSDEDLDFIIRFVRLMIRLGLSDLAKNSARTVHDIPEDAKVGAGKLYSGYEARVIALLEAGRICLPDDDDKHVFSGEVLQLLIDTFQQIPSKNRSNWLKTFPKVRPPKTDEDKKVLYMAEAIIDLCYNFVTEESVLNCSHHNAYIVDDNAFIEQFESRLETYWEDGKQGVHLFNRGDQETMPDLSVVTYPKWDTGTRMVKKLVKRQRNKKAAKHFKMTDEQLGKTCYEEGMKEDAKWWKSKLRLSIAREVFLAIFCMIIFFGVEMFANEVQDFVAFWIEDIAPFIAKYNFFDAIIVVIIVSVLFAVISQLFPDILDSFKQVKQAFQDMYRVKKAPRNVAYVKSDEEKETQVAVSVDTDAAAKTDIAMEKNREE